MRLAFAAGTPADAIEIAALRNATAADLTARHGKGPWSGQCTERGILFDLRHAWALAAREHGRLVATLVLATRKPWAIDRRYFTPVPAPLYLTSMAVAPDRQRHGLGRACLEYAADVARHRPADAIFLDAFDHPAAGAGEFYRQCGYREAGRVIYRNTPLIYFELLL